MNEDKRKILQTNAQHLVNPEQKGIRNKLLSWMLKDVNIDRLNVKHLEIYGKNTLTSPKVVVTDSSADPLVNGEITRNGATLKVKTAGSVVNIGRSIALDESSTSGGVNTADNNSSSIWGETIPSAYTTIKSVTLTPDVPNNAVVISASMTGHQTSSTGRIAYARVLEGSNVIIPEQSFDVAGSRPYHFFGLTVLMNQPASAKTYDLQVRTDNLTNYWSGASITGAVIKLS